ncbi:hypothetical protein CPC08DRAFT_712092 [Agrocybe pediades]|nr:hypothetical protein CPC08DRAFT_712092 [Agrocybe pediades]
MSQYIDRKEAMKSYRPKAGVSNPCPITKKLVHTGSPIELNSSSTFLSLLLLSGALNVSQYLSHLNAL